MSKLFIQTPLSLYQSRDISPSAKLLLGRLKLHQGKNDEGYASVTTLVEESPWSKRQISRLLKELKDKGRLKILSKSGQKLRFQIIKSDDIYVHAFQTKVKTRMSTQRRHKRPRTLDKNVHALSKETQDKSLNPSGNSLKKQKGKDVLKKVLKEARKEEGKTSSSPTSFETQKQTPVEEGVSKSSGQVSTTFKSEAFCPKCQGRIIQRRGKFGNFPTCENWPRCDYKPDKIPAHIRAIKGSDWYPEWKDQLPDD
ncbi:MAG: topoisomerase DNA-binding C4 zinc finger domain-containing protein [Thermodesulfobacteriota bacterium]|jgi:hypothetical protein